MLGHGRRVPARRPHAADDACQLGAGVGTWLGAVASLVVIAFVLEVLVPAADYLISNALSS